MSLKEQLSNEGFLFPLTVLDHSEANYYRSQFEKIEQVFGRDLTYVGNLHHHFDWAYELATNPKILNPVSEILTENSCILSTLILCKYPNTQSYVTWHQDGNNADWDSDNSISVWLGLSDSNAENGCLKVIPKTHKQAKLPVITKDDKNNIIRSSVFIDAEIDKEKLVNVVLKKGEMSIHHNKIVHSSEPNTTHKKRIGFVVRFGDVDQLDGSKKIIEIAKNKKRPELHLEKPKTFDFSSEEERLRLKNTLMAQTPK